MKRCKTKSCNGTLWKKSGRCLACYEKIQALGDGGPKPKHLRIDRIIGMLGAKR